MFCLELFAVPLINSKDKITSEIKTNPEIWWFIASISPKNPVVRVCEI